MPSYPADYYNRFDPADNYENHIFRAGKVLQSAEQNEIQSALTYRIKGVADALFKDGDVISNAQIVVNAGTGEATCQAGVIYLTGAMRGIVPRVMTIPIVGTVLVGVRKVTTIVTENDSAALRDPAVGLRNYQEPGASRLKVVLGWAYDTDGGTGDFYPIYTVNDGIVDPKEPPPNIDAISSAIASYDRQSTGGHYVSEGMQVTKLADSGNDQVYSIKEGLARIYGQLVVLSASLRVVYPVVKDLREIVSEPTVSSGPTANVVPLDFTPVQAIDTVTITTEVTDSMVRGNVAGTLDLIANGSVLSLTQVRLPGSTIYTQGVDYQLTGNSVDWSLAGIEPSTGTTFNCTYKYVATVAPDSFTETSVTVSGSVSGTLILVSYQYAVPRYDRLCLTKSGQVAWVNGVAADYNQIIPKVPSGMLSLATIYQSWTSTGRLVSNDGVRMVNMGEIEGINYNIIDLYDLVAENQLKLDVVGRDAAAKKGLFADGFRDNGYRDSGQSQTLIVSDELLQLPIVATINKPSLSNTSTVSISYTQTNLLTQDAKTASMQINPYMVFSPLPAQIKLNPSVDNAVTITTTWAPSVMVRSTARAGTLLNVKTRSITESNLALRQLTVLFTVDGFGSGEQLTSVIFDGINITSTVS